MRFDCVRSRALCAAAWRARDPATIRIDRVRLTVTMGSNLRRPSSVTVVARVLQPTHLLTPSEASAVQADLFQNLESAVLNNRVRGSDYDLLELLGRCVQAIDERCDAALRDAARHASSASQSDSAQGHDDDVVRASSQLAAAWLHDVESEKEKNYTASVGVAGPLTLTERQDRLLRRLAEDEQLAKAKHERALEALLQNRTPLKEEPLMELPRALIDREVARKITTLNLNHCNLRSLPNEISLLVSLEKLHVDGKPNKNVRGNDLTHLPWTIGGLRRLTVLSVTNNRLTTLPPSIGELHNLRVLWLNNNALVQLPHLATLELLERLVVCDNFLTILNSEICDMHTLNDVVFENNPLEYPPSSARVSLQAMKDWMRLHPVEEASSLAADLSWLLNEPRLSDLRLKTATETLFSQQAIAWARATLPLAERDHPQLWRSSDDKERQAIEAMLSPDNAEVKDFLQFLYTGMMKLTEHSEAAQELARRVGIPLTVEEAERDDFERCDDLPRTISLASGSTVPRPLLARHLSRLLSPTGIALFSDIKLVASDGPSFDAHRCVLAARAPYFRALFTSQMSDATMDLLEYADIAWSTMRSFLLYIYGDAIEFDKLGDDAVDLLVVADRFGVRRLVNMLQTIIADSCDTETAVFLFKLARQHGFRRMEVKTRAFIMRFWNECQSAAPDDWSQLSQDDLQELEVKLC